MAVYFTDVIIMVQAFGINYADGFSGLLLTTVFVSLTLARYMKTKV